MKLDPQTTKMVNDIADKIGSQIDKEPVPHILMAMCAVMSDVLKSSAIEMVFGEGKQTIALADILHTAFDCVANTLSEELRERN